LALVGRIALEEARRTRQQAAGGVAFLHGDLDAAEALVAEQRQAAGQGKQRAQPDLAVRRRRGRALAGGPAHTGEDGRRQAGEAGQHDASQGRRTMGAVGHVLRGAGPVRG
jgi:hypothetical protein